jgi:hypothetical protein
MTKSCRVSPAMHPPLPQVLNLGGPVLANPVVLPISWAADPQAQYVEKILGELNGTGYWAATTGEYGVGALTVATPVHMTQAVPSSFTDTKFLTLISQNTSGTSPAWGELDPHMIYLLVIPDGVHFDDGTGSICCSDYDGYHSEGDSNGKHFPYAVVCTCPGFDGPQETPTQQLTEVTSHELVEASTDPYTSSNPAYAEADADHAVWTVTTDGELADMCELNDDAAYLPPGGTMTVQRTWSNRAAAAGENPCVPAAPGFASAEPVLTAMGKLRGDRSWTTKVAKIAQGQTGVVDLQLFSSGPMPFDVAAYDLSADWYSGPRRLKLTLDRSTGANGDVLHLSITPMSFDTSMGGAVFLVESFFDGGTALTMGAVVAP